ncbi:MAG TPA: phospholipid carrier-dependent glycosyltransferase, partial [Anaerolineae bacterium]|nr:phospholipid carrier-dependent glycosyltransferase [Anaerolineae bacterium]
MNDRHDSLVALCLFALLFSLYLLTFSGVYHSSDEMSMLAATDSLARRGQWDIELLRWMGEQQGSFGPDGYLYSRKGIGTTLAALPHYFLAVQSSSVGNVQTAMLTNGVVTALTGVLVYLFLRRLRYGAGVSLGTALAYGLGTMAWPYARYLFSESLAALGLMLSAYFLVRFRDQGDRLSVVLAGAGLGIALLSRLNNAMVAPFLGLLLLAYLHQAHGRNLRKWAGPIVLFGLPVLAALVVIGWYNWLRFGSPLTTGYLPEERFATPFFEGLYGLLLSPGKGLLWYSPVLFAALAAWPAFFRRHRAEALLIAAVVLINVVFYAPWYLWWAGHAWGPRFLVTIVPFATLPLAKALKAARDRRWIAGMLAVLALVSIAVQLLGVAVDFNLYLEEIHAELGLYHPATLFDPDYSPLLRQITYLRLESLDLAWARGGSIEWLALLLGVFAVAVSGIALAVAVTGRPVRKRPSRWVGVGLPVLLAVVTVGLLLL